MWESYYEETDALQRAAIYAENVGQALPDGRRSALFNMRRLEPVTEEDALRRDLFLWRYTGPKGQEMDRVMTALMELIHLGRNRAAMDAGNARRLIQGLGWDVVREHGDAGQALLVAELQNGTARYLSTCHGNEYGRYFFGLVSASRKRQDDKTTEDLWYATRGIERLGTRQYTTEDVEHLHLYEGAVLDAFYAFDENARDWFADYERMH